jgi:hypothetical protein
LKSTIQKTLWAAALTVIATLGGMASAQAAVITGDFDPAFGLKLPDLGFSGSASLYVKDSCLLGATFAGTKDLVCTGRNSMYMLSADVDFYNLNDPSKTTLETLTFDSLKRIALNVVIADSNHDGKYEVVGFDTSAIGPEMSNLDIAGKNKFWLTFTQTCGASLSTFKPESEGDGDQEHRNVSCSGGAGQSNPAPFVSALAVVFDNPALNAVPEPGSLALMLAALGAGVMVRRRRA